MVDLDFLYLSWQENSPFHDLKKKPFTIKQGTADNAVFICSYFMVRLVHTEGVPIWFNLPWLLLLLMWTGRCAGSGRQRGILADLLPVIWIGIPDTFPFHTFLQKWMQVLKKGKEQKKIDKCYISKDGMDLMNIRFRNKYAIRWKSGF